MPSDLMTPDGVATALKAVLERVAGIGLVYIERKIVRTEDDVQRILWVPEQNQANAWFITLAPTGTSTTVRGTGHATIGSQGGGNDMTGLNFQIEGYYSVQNDRSSELAFRNLAFEVMRAINNYGIIAAGVGIVYQGPADITQLLYAMFAGSHAMHYTTITVGFTGRIN